MKFLRVFMIFIATFSTNLSIKEKSTLNIHKRVSLLKQKIRDEIHHKQKLESILPVDDYSYENDDFDANDLNTEPITPIMEGHRNEMKNVMVFGRNKKKKIKIPMPGNKEKQKNDSSLFYFKNETLNGTHSHSWKPFRSPRLKSKYKKPLEIFYRRFYNTDVQDSVVEWTHCQDLITPFLTGDKKNISTPKTLLTTDPVVLRLIQLINVNTTTYSKDEIYSILYQISNLQLRLFQWEVAPMAMLFNVIMKENKHNFLNLKRGIKELFIKWRLDISNVTNLLKQTRIFRPPCVKISDFDGSTKWKKVTRYPKKEKLTTKCEDYDEC